MIIRAAHCTKPELEAVWQLGQAFHKEFAAPANFPALARDRAWTHIAHRLARGPAFVAEEEGRIIGALLLERQEYWYSTEMMLTDCMFYVMPAARGRGAAQRLIKAAMGAAKAQNYRLMLTTSSGLVGPAIDRFYARLGLRRIGAAYLME